MAEADTNGRLIESVIVSVGVVEDGKVDVAAVQALQR